MARASITKASMGRNPIARASTAGVSMGSLTIFAALSLCLILSVICSFLEIARYQTYPSLLQENSDAALESVFAGYVIPLWEKYHLLGFEAEEEGGSLSLREEEALLQTYSASGLGCGEDVASNFNLFRGKLNNVTFLQYDLMTDDKGLEYETMVATMMKELSGVSELKKLLDNLDLTQENSMGDEEKESILEKAKNAVNDASLNNNSAQNRENRQENQNSVLEEKENIQEAGILELVVRNPQSLSQKSIWGTDLPSERNCFQGRAEAGAAFSEKERESAFYDKALMDYYHTKIFACYSDQKQGENLSYELEYLVAGKTSDMENLKLVLGQIYGMREACNYAYLLTDQTKQAEAMTLATSIAGVSVNPLIIEAVKQGILLCWASVESLLDVRALLEGKKIAIVKNSSEWTTSLSQLASYKSDFLMAEDCPEGQSYKEYLSCLLVLQSREKTAYRAMDLEELYVRNQEGYEDFRMDQLVVEAQAQFEYETLPIFAQFIQIGKRTGLNYNMTNVASYSY